MATKDWPETDRAWIKAYRVEASALELDWDLRVRREEELLAALREDGRSAEELFGPAAEVAHADAEEVSLAVPVPDKALALPAGPSGWLRQAGGGLLGACLVPALILSFAGTDTLRVTASHLWVVAAIMLGSILAGFAFRAVGAGKVRLGLVLGIDAVVAIVALVVVASLEPNRTWVVDAAAPRWLLSIYLLLPGAVLLILAALPRWWGLATGKPFGRHRPVPASGSAGPVGSAAAPVASAGTLAAPVVGPASPADGDVSEQVAMTWLRSYDEALRSRLVPAPSRRDAVREARSILAETHEAPETALGDPLVLATRLAAGDPATRRRRWILLFASGVGIPLFMGAMIVFFGPITAWDIAWGVLALVLATTSAVRLWRVRPGRQRQAGRGESVAA